MKIIFKLISHFSIALILISNSPIFSQEFLKNDAVHFAEMGLKLAKAPLNFEKDSWQKFSALAIATGSLFAVDVEIQEIFLKNQNSTNDRIFGIDKIYGNKTTFLTAVGLYGIGAIFKQQTLRRMGLNSTEAIAYSALLSGFLKFLFGRHRPDTGSRNLIFTPFQLKDAYQSLPSGHATVSMAFSTAMAKSIENVWWKSFWYSSGALVALARIYHDRHWASDVFLGAAIGYFVADFVVKNGDDDKMANHSRVIIFASGQRVRLGILF